MTPTPRGTGVCEFFLLAPDERACERDAGWPGPVGRWADCGRWEEEDIALSMSGVIRLSGVRRRSPRAHRQTASRGTRRQAQIMLQGNQPTALKLSLKV
jgi:hypothetical protein